MKIKFTRTIKFSREITIGLSVLLLLAVILIVVAARRFTRHGDPADAAFAMEPERAAAPREEKHDKALNEHRAAFAAPALVPVPGALREHEKDKLLETQSKEYREEKSGHAAKLGFATAEPAKTLVTGKHDRKANELPMPTALAPDYRYAVPPAAAPPSGPHELHDTGGAKPMVSQVSGDSLDGTAQRVDGQMPQRRAEATRPEPSRQENWIGGQRMAAEIADANRPDYRGPRAGEVRNDPASAPYDPARNRRYAYGASVSVAAVEGSQPGYPGPAAGYGRGDMPRRDEMPRQDQFPHREEFQRPLAENPLRNDGQYEVQPNDSFWTISQRVYGSGGYFRALAEANRGKVARPDRLQPGILISTPPIAQLEKDYADFCPRPNRREAVRNRAAGAASLTAYSGERIYVVQEGDTLTSIARHELGKVSRWAEIYQLNREALGKDFDYLTPGMKLAMPPRDGQPPERTTRRGDDARWPTRY